MSPVQILDSALMQFKACYGGLDIRAIRVATEEILDGYDAIRTTGKNGSLQST